MATNALSDRSYPETGISPLARACCLSAVMVWSLSACATQETPPRTALPPEPEIAQPATGGGEPAPAPANRQPVSEPLGCNKTRLCEVGGTSVWKIPDKQAFFFSAGMTIDADGAPDAYHPDNIGTDHLGNAGRPGNWWALVTDNGRPNGNPVIQGPGDPKPGYFVSMTALADTTKPMRDPRRWVDSNTVPYLVLPANQRGGAPLGDLGVAINRANGRESAAILADLGPRGKLGEGSIALAERLGVPSNPRRGGAASGIVYIVFTGSGNGKPRSVAEIEEAGARLFAQWGGMARVAACFDQP